jgi:histidinol dehydrogenase
VDDFFRWTSRIELRGGLSRLARAGAAVARHEGMSYHAASMEARI